MYWESKEEGKGEEGKGGVGSSKQNYDQISFLSLCIIDVVKLKSTGYARVTCSKMIERDRSIVAQF